MLASDADIDPCIAESVIIPNAVEMLPRPSWPPPKQSPMTVAIHRVAAVVRPVIEPPFFRMAHEIQHPTIPSKGLLT